MNHVCSAVIQKLSPVYKPCCTVFEQNTKHCAHDVRYERFTSGWVIRIADEAGGGGMAINFCPHCGQKL